MTYAPPPRISLISSRFNGKAVVVKLACAVKRLQLRRQRHHAPHGNRRQAPQEARHGRDREKALRDPLRPERDGTPTLNGTGKKLLKNLGKLATSGTVTVIQASGKSKSAATFKLTLK